MRFLIISLLIIFNSCDIKPKDEIHYYEQIKLIDQKKDEILKSKSINDTTLLGFNFGFNVDEYVNHINYLLEKKEIKGGPADFYWNVKFEEFYDYECFIKPEFYEGIFYEFNCRCGNKSSLIGIIGLDRFEKLLSTKYGRFDFMYKVPYSKIYKKTWLKNGQEIVLTYDEKYIYLNYKSIYYEHYKDSLSRVNDSLNFKKLKSKF